MWISKLHEVCNPIKKDYATQDETIVSTMESVLDACVITDDQCRVMGFNGAAEKVFGWKKQEIMGKNVTLLMPQAYANVHDTYVTTYHQTGHKKLIGVPRQLLARRKDGSSRPIMVSLGEIAQYKLGESKAAFVAIIRDVDDVLPVAKTDSNLTSETASRQNSEEPGEFPSISMPRSESLDSLVSKYPTPTYTSVISTPLDSTPARAASTNTEMMQKIEQNIIQSMMQTVNMVKSALIEEFDSIDKEQIMTKHKMGILETENKRLAQQIADQAAQIERLRTELEVLQRGENLSVLQVLRRNGTYLSFLSYCLQHKCSESVMFWKQAEEFKDKYVKQAQAVEDMAKESDLIMKKYLADSAPCHIAVAAAQLQAIKDQIASKTLTASLFAPIQDEIVKKLSTDVFDAFCKSAAGKMALAELAL